MRRSRLVTFVIVLAGLWVLGPQASSHREAPLIASDPLADNTDVYAFVDPNEPGLVTFIANFIPLEFPSSGPNFHRFDDNVLYEVMVDNNGDAVEDITFQFNFQTTVWRRVWLIPIRTMARRSARSISGRLTTTTRARTATISRRWSSLGD
ncbi:MAG: DUF4331 family protein [bacterium]